MPTIDKSEAQLNARYIAVRAAQTHGLTSQLARAAKDKTPGMRRILVPLLFQFWLRDREKGWALLSLIASETVRFPGLINRHTIEILGGMSLPILNEVHKDPQERARLAKIWAIEMAKLFESPLVKVGRFFARKWVLREGSQILAGMLVKQPAYQPVNYLELEVTYSRSAEFRALWSIAVGCLERPEAGPELIFDILMRRDIPYDLFLMLISERTLIFYGSNRDLSEFCEKIERIYRDGAPWFKHSAIYILFHAMNNNLEKCDKELLARYAAIIEDFFASGSWKMTTSKATYNLLNQAINSDVLEYRHHDGRGYFTLPKLLEVAVVEKNDEKLDGLFTAILCVASYHRETTLALSLLERAFQIGGAIVEARVLTALATLRLQDQPRVDDFLARSDSFVSISRAHIATVAPAVTDEDMLTLIDTFVVHMIVQSPDFRNRVAKAFRRAISAKSGQEMLAQVLAWVRDDLGEPQSKH